MKLATLLTIPAILAAFGSLQVEGFGTPYKRKPRTDIPHCDSPAHTGKPGSRCYRNRFDVQEEFVGNHHNEGWSQQGGWSPPSFCDERCKDSKRRQLCLFNCRQRDEMNDEEVGDNFGRPPHTRPQRPTGRSIWNSILDGFFHSHICIPRINP